MEFNSNDWKYSDTYKALGTTELYEVFNLYVEADKGYQKAVDELADVLGKGSSILEKEKQEVAETFLGKKLIIAKEIANRMTGVTR